MEWNDSYVVEAERTFGQRIDAACYHLVSRIRENVSIPSRTVTIKATRAGKAKKVLGLRGSNRSKPGEFPHKDYGTFRQSVSKDFDQATLTGRVGSPSKVGRWLELGTKKMRPRPWLRRSLAEERETIRQMIERGGRNDIGVGG